MVFSSDLIYGDNTKLYLNFLFLFLLAQALKQNIVKLL